MPAFRSVAPEDSPGGDRNRGPAFGVSAGELPRAVTAEREAGEVGARRVSVKLGGLRVERGHGHAHHVGVGPVAILRALRHHDDEGPALRMVAHGCRQANLRLPHALRAALAAPMQKEDDRPLLVVVSLKTVGKVNGEVVDGVMKFKRAVEKAGFLKILRTREMRLRRGQCRRRRYRQCDLNAGSRQDSHDSKHVSLPS